MTTRNPPAPRLGVVMRPGDLSALDRLAAAQDVSRACYARRVLRQHLREIAATAKAEALA